MKKATVLDVGSATKGRIRKGMDVILPEPEPLLVEDDVNHPGHYTHGEIECIDAIEAMLGRDGFIAFLRGQVLKYTWRMEHKGNPLTDSRKCEWYQNKLIEVLEAE